MVPPCFNPEIRKLQSVSSILGFLESASPSGEKMTGRFWRKKLTGGGGN